jgi:hypothetical protein
MRVYEARMQVGSTAVFGEAPALPVLRPGDQHRFYVPFGFDNEALWNAGLRTGTLRLRFLDIGSGRDEIWELSMQHIYQRRYR